MILGIIRITIALVTLPHFTLAYQIPYECSLGRHGSLISRLYSSGELDGDDQSEMSVSAIDDFLRQKRSKRWILFVDDEEAIRKAVGQMLFDQGFQVTACADGATALQIALDGRNGDTGVPDVIVSDIRMPGGMDGLELLERIRSSSNLFHVPVVLLTAKGQVNDRIAGYEAGADSYLPKPFDPDELVTIIDNLIERHDQLSSSNVRLEDLQNDLQEIKTLLLKKGGAGIGNGWIESTRIFLAPDERQVLELLCEGLRTQEIADRTFISKRRVEQLLTSMFRKTKVKNRTELIRWAIATGNAQI